MLANGNLIEVDIEVDSDFGYYFITIYYRHSEYDIFTTSGFNYLFSGAEYLGEL